MDKKRPALPFTSFKVASNITKIVIPAPQNDSFSFKLLALSDTHFDSNKSDHDLLKNFCDQAVEEKAGIFINGDAYDCMAGPDDARNARATLRSEISRKKYFDDIVTLGCKLLHPYRYNLISIGQGNHESSVLKRYGTDLIERTVAILTERGSSVTNGMYEGWLDFKFVAPTNAGTQIRRVAYHHGTGYSSETKRKEFCAEHPDADMAFFGDTHRYYLERYNRKRRTLTDIFDDDQLVLGIPGLKDDTIEDGKLKKKGVYGNKSSDWATEKGIRSKPLGGWWVEFTWSRYYRRYIYAAKEVVPK